MAYGSGDTLVRVTMSALSGIAKDKIVNDFAFSLVGGSPDATDYGHLLDAVDGFYRDTQAGGHAVGEYIDRWVDRAATHKIDMYAITAPPLGSPVATYDWLGPVNAPDVNGLPTEVAGVLSFKGDYTGVLEESGATRPRARRRGRVYIGPLAYAAFQVGTAPHRLSANFTQTLREAADAMATEAASHDWIWSVWSRKSATLFQVTGGWTDDRPDAQRRRGPAAASRTSFTL